MNMKLPQGGTYLHHYKSLGLVILLLLNEVSDAHKACIYLIKYTLI